MAPSRQGPGVSILSSLTMGPRCSYAHGGSDLGPRARDRIRGSGPQNRSLHRVSLEVTHRAGNGACSEMLLWSREEPREGLPQPELCWVIPPQTLGQETLCLSITRALLLPHRVLSVTLLVGAGPRGMSRACAQSMPPALGLGERIRRSPPQPPKQVKGH